MKIIRYEDRSGKIHYAVQRQGAESLRINGDPLQGFEVTSERAVAGKILASSLGVGKRHPVRSANFSDFAYFVAS